MGMTTKDRLTLQRNYKQLIEINYSVISAHLISALIIDLDMHADIESCLTERKKMEKLLFTLPSRGALAMKEFISALRPNYAWIASKLEEDARGGGVNDLNSNGSILNNCNNILSHSTSGLGNSSAVRGPQLENLKDISISAHIRPIQKMMQKSVRLCRSWYLLAHAMKLDANVIADIHRDMTTLGGTEYAIQSTLLAWISKCGPSKATFGHLVQITEGEDVNEVTEGLIELWTSLQ